VYVLAVQKGGLVASFLDFKVALNGRLVGHAAPGTYLYVETSPGLVKVCTKRGRDNPTLLYLTAEAGKRYYLTLLGDLGIGELTEDEARKRIKKYTYVTFEPKP
jgi:hypothetical protein